MEKIGIQNLKETIHAVVMLAKVLGPELHDGFQINDLVAVIQKVAANDAKKAILEAAIKDITKVPAEAGDLDLGEIVELSIALVKELPEILAAFKSEGPKPLEV